MSDVLIKLRWTFWNTPNCKQLTLPEGEWLEANDEIARIMCMPPLTDGRFIEPNFLYKGVPVFMETLVPSPQEPNRP